MTNLSPPRPRAIINDDLSEIFVQHDLCSIAESPRCQRASLADVLDWIRPNFFVPGCTHQSFWARESIQRAQSLLDLFLVLETNTWRVEKPTICAQLDLALAKSLIHLYRSLDISAEKEFVPCRQSLIGVVAGLAELFGPTIGTLQINTKVMRLSLSGIRRRALVLAASEIVTNIIRYAFHRSSCGQVLVSLEPITGSLVQLAIESDGTKLANRCNDQSLAVISGLAEILDGDVQLRDSSLGGSMIVLTFPDPDTTSTARLGINNRPWRPIRPVHAVE